MNITYYKEGRQNLIGDSSSFQKLQDCEREGMEMARYATKNELVDLAANIELDLGEIFKFLTVNKTLVQKQVLYKINESQNAQFMGLKDKNGTLIYFGDILKDEYNNLLTPVCEALNGEHILFFKPLKHLHNKLAMGCKSTYSETLEVIGNVNENPELIKTLFTIKSYSVNIK